MLVEVDVVPDEVVEAVELTLDTVATVDVVLVVSVDVTTVPVDFNLSADILDIIST